MEIRAGERVFEVGTGSWLQMVKASVLRRKIVRPIDLWRYCRARPAVTLGGSLAHVRRAAGGTRRAARVLEAQAACEALLDPQVRAQLRREVGMLGTTAERRAMVGG